MSPELRKKIRDNTTMTGGTGAGEEQGRPVKEDYSTILDVCDVCHQIILVRVTRSEARKLKRLEKSPHKTFCSTECHELSKKKM